MKEMLLIAMLIALAALMSGCNYDDAFRAADSAARSYYSRPPAGYTPTYQQPGYYPAYQPTYH